MSPDVLEGSESEIRSGLIILLLEKPENTFFAGNTDRTNEFRRLVSAEMIQDGQEEDLGLGRVGRLGPLAVGGEEVSDEIIEDASGSSLAAAMEQEVVETSRRHGHRVKAASLGREVTSEFPGVEIRGGQRGENLSDAGSAPTKAVLKLGQEYKALADL